MHFPPALDPFRALGAAWRILFRSFGPLIVGGVLLVVFDNAKLGFGVDDDVHFWRQVVEHVLGAACCGLVGLLVTAWIEIGFARCVEATARDGTTSFETLFDSRGRYGEMLLALFLRALIAIALGLPFFMLSLGGRVLDRHTDVPEPLIVLAAIAAVIVYVPVMLYVLLGIAFVPQAIALEGRSATDAFRRSWEIARGHRLALFVLFLVLVVLAFVGLCCCLVGVLFTGTLANVAKNEAFLAWTRPAERAGWWIAAARSASAPPPPTTAIPTA